MYHVWIDDEHHMHLDADNWTLSEYKRFLRDTAELKRTTSGTVYARVDYQNKTVSRLLKAGGFIFSHNKWEEKDLVVSTWYIKGDSRH